MGLDKGRGHKQAQEDGHDTEAGDGGGVPAWIPAGGEADPEWKKIKSERM